MDPRVVRKLLQVDAFLEAQHEAHKACGAAGCSRDRQALAGGLSGTERQGPARQQGPGSLRGGGKAGRDSITAYRPSTANVC